MCERELETEQNCNILTFPAPLDIAVCRSCSPGLLSRGPEGPASLGYVLIPASSHQLVTKLTDFLSSPSYIIVQSPTQYLPITGHRDVSLLLSLEWHVCLSSSGNNCHAVHRSLSSGVSVYDCSMGFYLVSPTRFLPITAIGMCHFLPVHHFGMACLAGSKVNIQNYN